MADGPAPDLASNDALDRARAERDAWAQELFESNRVAAELVVKRQALADRLAAVESQVRAESARDVDAARRERDHALEARDAALRERDQAIAARQEAEAMLRRVTGSTAWRLTAPLRHGMMLLLGRERGDR